MKIRIAKNVKAGQEAFTGFAGQYLTAPEAQGTYSLYEIFRETEDGQMVHEDFEWGLEGQNPCKEATKSSAELDKLEAYLKDNGFEYHRDDADVGPECMPELNHHQIVCTKNGKYQWDAVCHFGSYGYKEGLLEIMGKLVNPKVDGDTVVGWLTAEDVIERIETLVKR